MLRLELLVSCAEMNVGCGSLDHTSETPTLRWIQVGTENKLMTVNLEMCLHASEKYHAGKQGCFMIPSIWSRASMSSLQQSVFLSNN